MQRTNVYLDDDQIRALKHLAAETGQSMAVLVRRAIDEYLAENFRDSDDWGERFDALVKRVQSRIPSGITPEQIEADITAAREEARRARQKGHNS